MGTKAVICVLGASALFTLLTAMFVSLVISHLPQSPFIGIMSTVLAVLSTVGILLCWDIARLHPDDKHTLSSLWFMYYKFRFTSPPQERRAHEEFEKHAENGKKVQEELLMQILKMNSDSAYGRDYRLSDIQSREDFVKKHPLTDYSHYESYCDRVAQGEKGVMTTEDVVYLALSSGTTGKTKKYPVTRDFRKFMLPLISHHNHILRPIYNNSGLRKRFQFRVFHPRRMSEGGILMGGGGQLAFTPGPADGNVTPEGFLEIFDERAIFYVQAVFALADREIGIIDGFSPDLMYSFFNFMVKHRDELCNDIERGEIQPYPNLPEHVRNKMSQKLYPDPRRAHEVHSTLSGSAKGLALRLWPELQFVIVAKSGGFAHTYRLLNNTYINGLRASYPLHLATEGIGGLTHVSDALDSAIYTFHPHATFFEFIPISNHADEQPKTLFLDQVKVGEQYELVLTNPFGLYRNRFGDVIEIVGFYKTLPKYRFLYRSGQILTVAYDRTPESIMFEAIKRTEAKWTGLTITDYTATESFHVEELLGEVYSPACYVLFMEVTDGKDDVMLTADQCKMFEETLCKTHETYAEYRGKGSLGPVKIIQVKSGTFARLHAALQGSHPSFQFKIPRVQRKQPLLQILVDGMIRCL